MKRVLFAIIGACVVWLGSVAGIALLDYYRLSSSAEAQITDWSVAEESESEVYLAATYVYVVDGKSYEGKTIFQEPRFLNRFSAEEQLKGWQGLRYKVWYAAGKPELSSLQRLFPLKKSVYAFLALGVFGFLSVATLLQSKVKNRIVTTLDPLP
jgi:hypothetical protein